HPHEHAQRADRILYGKGLFARDTIAGRLHAGERFGDIKFRRHPRSPLFPYTTLFRSLVASLPLIKERILVIILLLHFLSLMLGSVLVLMLPLLVWLTPDLRIKKSLLKCNWTIRKRLPRCKIIT